MTSLHVEPTGATLGAVVTGVRLAALEPHEWALIEEAFDDYAVLVFPDQHLSEAEQVVFGRRFGDLSIEVLLLSNRREDGTLVDEVDPMRTLLEGNEDWHTDSSFKRLAAKASILSAREVPRRGGETEWADMRAAYEALTPGQRDEVSGLSAYHSLVHSQAKVGADPAETAVAVGLLTYVGAGPRRDASTDRSDPLRPLVKVHPRTGRPALYVGRHAYGIPGLEPEASERLLGELVAFACRPPRTYQHCWRPGDVVVWDNRCVLHRARPYEHTEPRVMVHTRVAGDPATELAS